jgi:hypothetical protein
MGTCRQRCQTNAVETQIGGARRRGLAVVLSTGGMGGHGPTYDSRQTFVD